MGTLLTPLQNIILYFMSCRADCSLLEEKKEKQKQPHPLQSFQWIAEKQMERSERDVYKDISISNKCLQRYRYIKEVTTLSTCWLVAAAVSQPNANTNTNIYSIVYLDIKQMFTKTSRYQRCDNCVCCSSTRTNIFCYHLESVLISTAVKCFL